MKISQAIQGYKIAKMADSYSPSTLMGYKYYLEQIVTRLHDMEKSEVTPDELREYFVWLRTQYVLKRVSKEVSPLKTTSKSGETKEKVPRFAIKYLIVNKQMSKNL
jgi:hypothetical protein